jgi:hypothetical protein
LDAKNVVIKEEIPASRKLAVKEARSIAKASSKVYIAKGKKLDVFDMKSASLSEVTEKMLGPTGNLRAPTMRVGKITVVGFSDDAFQTVLG